MNWNKSVHLLGLTIKIWSHIQILEFKKLIEVTFFFNISPEQN